MVDPATAMLIAAAVNAAAQGASGYFSGQREKKVGQRRSKEMKRETLSNIFNEALNRSAELEADRMSHRQGLTKSHARGFQGTADIVREAARL